MAFSVTTIQSRLEKRLGDISDVDFILEIAEDLNQYLYQEMVATDPSQFYDTTSFTVTTQGQTFDLPADLQDFSSEGCGFYVQENGTTTSTRLVETSYGSLDRGYYLDGVDGNGDKQVVFNGITTSTVIVLRYIPTLASIDSLDDTFCVENRYKELVLEGMVLYYYRYNEDAIRESEQGQRFNDLLAAFLDNFPRNPQVFALTDISSSY